MRRSWGHKSAALSPNPLLGIRREGGLWIPRFAVKDKQISSQDAPLLRTCHTLTMLSGIRRTAHFTAPLDKHNLKQEWVCSVLTCLIPITANYTHSRNSIALPTMASLWENEHESQYAIKVVNNFLHLLEIRHLQMCYFSTLGSDSLVSLPPIWTFRK